MRYDIKLFWGGIRSDIYRLSNNSKSDERKVQIWGLNSKIRDDFTVKHNYGTASVGHDNVVTYFIKI